jgi:protoporphyrinogen oxidase
MVEAARFTLRHYPVIDLVRFGLVGLYLKLTPRWRPLERVTAHEWMRRRVGERMYRALWEPLLVGKFGDHAPEVNMAWLWARIHARTTRLGTFVGGFQEVMDRLADAVRARGGEIRLGAPVLEVRPGGDAGPLSVVADGGPVPCDAVISTTSPALLARLTPALPDSYADGLRSLDSMGAVVLVASLEHRLTQYYWHNLPKGEGFPFLAMVEHTNFVSPEHYGGDHIVYCGDYVPPDSELLSMPQAAIEAEWLPTLARFNPSFELDWVRGTWLFRTPYGQPVPKVDHSRRIPDLRTPVRGLYLASMSQVYPWDRGTNFAVEIGRRTARLVHEDLAG